MALGINMVDSKRIKSRRLMAHDAALFNRAQDLLLWDNRWLPKLKPGPAELAQDPCWQVVKKWAIKPLGKRQEFILYERAPACQAPPKAD
jgi:hypothetical protein